jgi:hypothetical protein
LDVIRDGWGAWIDRTSGRPSSRLFPVSGNSNGLRVRFRTYVHKHNAAFVRDVWTLQRVHGDDVVGHYLGIALLHYRGAINHEEHQPHGLSTQSTNIYRPIPPTVMSQVQSSLRDLPPRQVEMRFNEIQVSLKYDGPSPTLSQLKNARKAQQSSAVYSYVLMISVVFVWPLLMVLLSGNMKKTNSLKRCCL